MTTSINSNPLRTGNITSSEIVALVSNGRGKGEFGKPFYTYIEECNMERRLGRSITDEVNARPLAWGTLLEKVPFEKLGTEYRMCSSETISHKTIPYWKGSPDAEKFDTGKTACDIKCPMTLKSFCTLVDSFRKGGINQVRDDHKDGDKYYWQIVSNAILLDAKFGELIVYMPYKSELDSIRDLARNYDGPDQYKFYWIGANERDEELPHLIDGGFYKDVNVLRFEIPQADKDLLTDRVVKAGALLDPIVHEAT